MGLDRISHTQASDRDHRALSSSLLMAAVFGAGAMLYSLVLFRYQFQWEHGRKIDVWYAPLDIWNIVDGGRYVWHGALGYVYTSSGQSYALPLSYILTAPVSALIDHFHLVEGLFPIPRPSAWPLVAAFSLLFNVFLLDAVRRVAWDLGVRRRLWLTQASAVLVVLVPAFALAHFEDVLALTFLLHASRLLIRQEPLKAAVLLSLAISSKQWAMLAIPLFVFWAPRGRRLLTLLISGALPGLLILIVLTSDPHNGFRALFSPDSPLDPKANPGHFSFFYSWFGGKTSRITRSLAVALSPLVAIPFRNTREPAKLLVGLSLVLIVRPLFEPTNFAYYWMPALLLAGLVGGAVHERFRLRDWLWSILAILWAVPHGNPSTSLWWWTVETTFLLAIWVQVSRSLRLFHGLANRIPPAEDHLQETAILASLTFQEGGVSEPVVPHAAHTLPLSKSFPR